tara:strand:- start:257 stop:463 length:207 start_codon:yes stop_codon:yes gene_type:complete
MKYFKRKDGSVFGKINPSKQQISSYKKDGCVACDENGKTKSKPKKKDDAWESAVKKATSIKRNAKTRL